METDRELLNKINQLFPGCTEELDRELVINIIPPNGRNLYERLTIRPIPDDEILPQNSFHMKHFTAWPSTEITDTERIIKEFTFAVNNGNVEAYWTQDGKTYKDAHRTPDHAFYASTDEIKADMVEFVDSIKIKIDKVNDVTNEGKINKLALALAKSDVELSYNELSKITGLSKDDIDKHWKAADEIAKQSVALAELYNKNLEHEIAFNTQRHVVFQEIKELKNENASLKKYVAELSDALKKTNEIVGEYRQKVMTGELTGNLIKGDYEPFSTASKLLQQSPGRKR